jgi:hypothetical protein
MIKADIYFANSSTFYHLKTEDGKEVTGYEGLFLIIHEFKKNNPGVCYYCGKHVEGKDKTVDHKIPIIRGGKTWYSNLVIACKRCNRNKSNMTDAEYMEYLYSNKNKQYKRKVLDEIKDKTVNTLDKKIILQDHIIMEARQDSPKRTYVYPVNKYITHMDSLFKQIHSTY